VPVLTIRAVVPTALSPAVRATFEAEPTISSLTFLPGASTRPIGDVYEVDLPRESANALIERLKEIGVQVEGTIQVQPVPTWISEPAFRAEQEDVVELFTPYGEVVNCALPLERDTGRKRGFAFVEMADAETETRAIDALQGAELMGRPLRINKAVNGFIKVEEF
jgi:RNA recognition motif-containing protein